MSTPILSQTSEVEMEDEEWQGFSQEELHWEKQIISEGRATLQQIPSKDMVADGLAKPLVKVKHEKMVQELYMTSQ